MSSSTSSRKESERTRLIQEKCLNLLNQLLRDEDNKFCVDCDCKGPRWASWNLGVFLCIRCAGIHRNLGVHISRVKSVNLDTWSPEQVVSLQQMGNSRARAVYEAQLPDGFRRPQIDTALETFIRAKYEHKKYLAREWVPPSPPKVDWGREIDEELEKQKRKKKSQMGTASIGGLTSLTEKKTTTGTSIKNTPLPAPLPKPKSSNSPKSSNRIDLNSAASNNSSAGSNNSSDLLGLSSPTTVTASCQKESNDSFTGFLSAAESGPEQKTTTTGNSLAKEEEDFFNQTSFHSGGAERDKNGKLTKDSILALYGSPGQTTNQLGQFNNNPLLNSGGGFNSLGNFPGQSQTFMNTGGGLSQQMFPQFGGSQPNSLTTTNLNLAGMPQQNLMGPQQPQQPHQFMTPPTMYNTQPGAPGAFAAPGAFTGSNFTQFPNYGGGLIQSNSFSNNLIGGFFNQQQQQQQHQQQQQPTLGNNPTGGIMQQQSTGQATGTLNQLGNQFGNLNLGNVWQ